jgi:bacteriorhodopsin|uniref:hypothetical protein n=1 Tax=Serratia proteamaculans TaxID=28151 RepID=UPI001F4BF9A8|nr:hypothetical protein [Serratia proteamaculans]
MSGEWHWVFLSILIACVAVFGIMSRPESAPTIIGIIGVIFVVVCIGSYYAYASGKDQKWYAWASEHCKIVEKKEGHTSFGVGVSTSGHAGAFASPTPGQTAYLCDDGITYWKNN